MEIIAEFVSQWSMSHLNGELTSDDSEGNDVLSNESKSKLISLESMQILNEHGQLTNDDDSEEGDDDIIIFNGLEWVSSESDFDTDLDYSRNKRNETVALPGSIEAEYNEWRAGIVKCAQAARREYEEFGRPSTISKYLQNMPGIVVTELVESTSETLNSFDADTEVEPHKLDLDLDHELNVFLRTISLDRADAGYRHRSAFIHELERLLEGKLPGVIIHPFGSFLTGLGDASSDVDIYVNLRFCKNKNIKGETPDEAYRKVLMKKDGQFVPNIPLWEQELADFYKISDIIHDSGLYTCIDELPYVRVPIIKLKHIKYGINCDLSFKNVLSTQNSRLILLYTKLDPRIGPIIQIVRYWAKFHEFRGSLQIKTYAFNLMVLFYFMKQKFVPTIHELQSIDEAVLKELDIDVTDEVVRSSFGFGGDTKEMISGWNGGFLDNVDIILQFMNKTTHTKYQPWSGGGGREDISGSNSIPYRATELLSILKDFIEFCGTFNYLDDMISPLTGEIRPKLQFQYSHVDELPEQFQSYKERIHCGSSRNVKELQIERRKLCIQDPFVLNFNVTRGTQLVDIENWQYCCKLTAEAIKSMLENKTVGDGGSFNDIFFHIDFEAKLGIEQDRDWYRPLKLFDPDMYYLLLPALAARISMRKGGDEDNYNDKDDFSSLSSNSSEGEVISD